ncbi:MAG: PEP-utilizing enzyme [Firmicutes bacterium]|nr:PEP-utilizing enzyme [Bacillota bacterium]MDH7496128.1 PEP/pyruvate-binding domain-containing protein [Bacillota bacterium]
MEPFVLRIDEIEPQHYAIVGGKARNLARLVRAGLPVPSGFVVTTTAYLRHADGAGLGEGSDEQGAAGHSSLWNAVRAAYEELVASDPGASCAVRSSANVEDEVGASHAGQYETILGVRTWDALVEAIRACWGSLNGDRTRAYSPHRDARRALIGAERAMAVLVQIEVAADVSGVLFTLNPQSGRENEMLVEATWGLGEALVAGLATPDRFVVDTWTATIVDARVSDKKLMVAAGGAEPIPVPGEMRTKRTLDDASLVLLARLGERIQEEYGLPQDIEWAMSGGEIMILQARPLTAFSFAEDFGEWTSANFREVMPGFASYLSQSMSFHHDFARATEEVFKRTKLFRREDEGTRWAATFFGHGYWNVGATKRVAARVPGFRERAFDRTVGIVPSYEGDGVVTPWTPATVLRAIPSLFALRKHYRLAVEEARSFISWFDANEPRWDLIKPEELKDEDLESWTRFAIDLHWQANRWALVISLLGTQAQDDFHATVERLNRRVRRPGTAVSEARLLTGLSKMATAKPLAAIWELARFAQTRPPVADTLKAMTPEELAQAFRRWEREAAEGSCAATLGMSPDMGEFWARFEACVREFRYMSEIDEDLSVPRWCEDVALPLSMLQACLSGEVGQDPRQQIARQEQVRAEEEEAAACMLRSRGLASLLNPFRVSGFRAQLELVRRLAWWREETRVYLSRARYHTRRFLKEQGRRWAACGLLRAEDDIFWLSRDEVLGLLEGSTGVRRVREIVERRRRIPVAYRNFVPPPVIMPGPARILVKRSLTVRGKDAEGQIATAHISRQNPATPPAERIRHEGAGETYAGVGCSAGVARGVVRVIRSLDEAGALKKGDVLVAPFANPGWMPLFNVASAIVLEEGGLLSHSAVVAREYGIPAVLQVEGATTKLRTGDLVYVDGGRGVVEVIRRNNGGIPHSAPVSRDPL